MLFYKNSPLVVVHSMPCGHHGDDVGDCIMRSKRHGKDFSRACQPMDLLGPRQVLPGGTRHGVQGRAVNLCVGELKGRFVIVFFSLPGRRAETMAV